MKFIFGLCNADVLSIHYRLRIFVDAQTIDRDTSMRQKTEMPSLHSVKHSTISALEYNYRSNSESQIHVCPEMENFLEFEMDSLRVS
ncbi:hypothetical protein TNCT_696571 [Trichonephila clavata]|uniref:Uncharacterized protein n=1 Tax=Trichonephila clavata TaxID=2740835 RepID=A0A8X6M2F8_TRICU|nr:hypothetical protein TNCT_696571 [Trichonephila clavata]